MRMPWQDRWRWRMPVVETEVEMSGKPEAGAVDAVHEMPPAEPVRPQVVEQTLF